MASTCQVFYRFLRPHKGMLTDVLPLQRNFISEMTGRATSLPSSQKFELISTYVHVSNFKLWIRP
jgi:hypothetical protein